MMALEPIEYAILSFLIRRKRQCTLRVIHANVTGYSEREVKSWLVTMAMKGLIKPIEGEGDLKYVLTTQGFIAWDNV